MCASLDIFGHYQPMPPMWFISGATRLDQHPWLGTPDLREHRGPVRDAQGGNGMGTIRPASDWSKGRRASTRWADHTRATLFECDSSASRAELRKHRSIRPSVGRCCTGVCVIAPASTVWPALVALVARLSQHGKVLATD